MMSPLLHAETALTTDDASERQGMFDGTGKQTDLASSTRNPQYSAAEMIIRVRPFALSTRSDPNSTYTGGGPVPCSRPHPLQDFCPKKHPDLARRDLYFRDTANTSKYATAPCARL